jgi:hypothetical protein
MLKGKLVARRRSYFLRVRATFLAEAERSAFVRLAAAARAWRESAAFDAALRGSRFSAFFLARERVADGSSAERPFFSARLACLRVFAGPRLLPVREALLRRGALSIVR